MSQIYFDASALYHKSVEDREKVRINYRNVKARRDEENALIDVCIGIYTQSVSTMDGSMKGMVTDHNTDGDFDSRIDR